MIRTQIQLTEAQSEQLKAIAEEQDISVAELIHRAVDTWLEATGHVSLEQRRQRRSVNLAPHLTQHLCL